MLEDRLAGLLRVDAGDEAVLAVGVFLALFGVELAGLAGDALGDDLGVFVDVGCDMMFLSYFDRGNDFLRRLGHGVGAR